MAKKQAKPAVVAAKQETKAIPTTPQPAKDKAGVQMAFGKENYIIMAVGMAVIVLGFILMSGTEEIFSFTKITLAPVLVILGFVIEVFAIVYKPKD